MTGDIEPKPVEGRVTHLYRHPVKGLTPEPLESVALETGGCVPNDRRFGLAVGGVQGGAAKTEWLGWRNFLMLKHHPRLAMLQTAFDDETDVLTVFRDGRQVARGKPADRIGRSMLEDFFAAFMKDDLAGKRPKLIEAASTQFSDNGSDHVSILNAATVRDIERVAGRPVDLRRLRGNIVIDGAAAWAERTWIGKEISVGGVRLRIDANIDRCGAPNVNPDTAERDMNLIKDLQRGFGHVDCGVYAEVIGGGRVSVGDAVAP